MPDKWYVHLVDGNNRIFFQKRDMTGWDLPEEVYPQMSITQLQFLMFICTTHLIPYPRNMKRFLDTVHVSYLSIQFLFKINLRAIT